VHGTPVVVPANSGIAGFVERNGCGEIFMNTIENFQAALLKVINGKYVISPNVYVNLKREYDSDANIAKIVETYYEPEV
jgi:hypothetical protein